MFLFSLHCKCICKKKKSIQRKLREKGENMAGKGNTSSSSEQRHSVTETLHDETYLSYPR